MSDMIPKGLRKDMRKVGRKQRKHGAAKISKATAEKIRPKEDVGKFIAKKVKVYEKEGLTHKQAMGKAFGVAKKLGFNVPNK